MPFSDQTGPNKTPVAAICLTSLLSMAFIFIGQVNVLAPIVTINFMLTYSFIDYSFFSVAMTFQLQTREKRDVLILRRSNPRSSTSQSSRPLMEAALPNYGSGSESPQSKGTLLEFTKDMDQIFSSLSSRDAGEEKTPLDLSSRSKSRRAKATMKQKLMDSFDLNSNMFSAERGKESGSSQPQEAAEISCDSSQAKAGEDPQVNYSTKTCHVEQHPSFGPQSQGTGDQLQSLDQMTIEMKELRCVCFHSLV